MHLAATLFDDLDVTISVQKSVLHPVNKIQFLGFGLNSINMTITLIDKKKTKIIDLGMQLLRKKRVTIQQLASFIGNIVAAEPGVYGAPLYTKGLEILQNDMLVYFRGYHD